MSPLSAVALLFLCATPALSNFPVRQSRTAGFQHESSYQSVSSANSAPVVQTKSSFKGCSSASGCGGLTVENGQITEQFGNPAALGINGEISNINPADFHKKFALQAADINSAFASSLPSNGPFWWNTKDSPFKDTYETYMKWLKEDGFGAPPPFNSPCGTSTCPFGSTFNSGSKVATSGGASSNTIDIANNPFLNGQFASAAGFNSASGLAGVDASKNPFLNGNIHLPGFGASTEQKKTNTVTSFGSSSSGGSFGSGGSINIESNPFLNGAISGTAGGCGGGKAGGCGGSTGIQNGGTSTYHQGTTHTQTSGSTGFDVNNLNKNPFLNGQITSPSGGSNTIRVTGSSTVGCSGTSCGSPPPAGGFQNQGVGCSGPACGTQTQQAGGYQTGGFQSQVGCSGGACGVPSQPTGCGGPGGACGYDQQQVVQGFNQVQTSCSGPFCGQDQQVQQQFPTGGGQKPIPDKPPQFPIPNRPPPQAFPNKPPTNVPHPPGATAGGFKITGQSSEGELLVTCSGTGFICVEKNLCLNGYINDSGENILQVRGGSKCRTSSEVCCQLKPKSTTTTSQFTNYQSGSNLNSASQHSTAPGLIHVPGTDNTGSQVNSGFISQTQKNTATNGFGQTGFGQTQTTTGFGQTNFGQTQKNTATTGFGQTNFGQTQKNTATTGFGQTNFGQTQKNTASTGFGQTGFGQTQKNTATTGFDQTGFGQTQKNTATGFGQTGFDQKVTLQSTKPEYEVRPPYTATSQTGVYKDSVISQSQDQYFTRPTFGNPSRPGTPYLPPEDKPKPYEYPEPKKPFNPIPLKYTPKPTPSAPIPIYVPPAPKPTPIAPKPTPATPKPTPYVPQTKPTPFVPPKSTPTRTPGYLPPKDEDESPQPSFGSQRIVPRPNQSIGGGELLLDNFRTTSPPIKDFNPGTPVIPSGCAAALKCTPKEFCTADGIISNSTIILTKEQEEFRVPLTDCKEPTTGLVGKCCRDPTYTDPWPTNQLGQWVPGAFGDTGAYRADQYRGKPNRGPNVSNNGLISPDNRPYNNGLGLNPAGSINNPIYAANPNQINPQRPNYPPDQQRPLSPALQVKNPVNPAAVGNVNRPNNPPKYPAYPTGPGVTPEKQVYPPLGPIARPNYPVNVGGIVDSPVNPNSQVNTENLYTTGQLLLSNFNQAKDQKVQSGSGTCGVRKGGTRPFGNKELFEADFGEIPWQAMVLLETNRTLLCGGVITSEDIVVTSAHCIDGFDAKNILVKGGEWKLGIDEEPRPFQIVQVAKVHKHPQYFSGSLQNDIAILVLSEKLRLAPHVAPICLPPASQESDIRLYKGSGYKCITTGWGKQVLQINIPNSIIHSVDMNLIPPQQCQAQITQNYPHLLENYNPNSCICGAPRLPAANVCKVDIGSALACTSGDGTYYMEGVYSWDAGCTSSNQLAAFYKFDATWYQNAISGANIQSQLIQQQQFVTNNNQQAFNNQALNQQQQQQAQYSQVKQTVTKHGQSYALSGQKAYEQALNGHVHAGGQQCHCFEDGKK